MDITIGIIVIIINIKFNNCSQSYSHISNDGGDGWDYVLSCQVGKQNKNCAKIVLNKTGCILYVHVMHVHICLHSTAQSTLHIQGFYNL